MWFFTSPGFGSYSEEPLDHRCLAVACGFGSVRSRLPLWGSPATPITWDDWNPVSITHEPVFQTPLEIYTISSHITVRIFSPQNLLVQGLTIPMRQWTEAIVSEPTVAWKIPRNIIKWWWEPLVNFFKMWAKFSLNKLLFKSTSKNQNLLKEYPVSTGSQNILRWTPLQAHTPTHQVKNSSQNFIHCLNLLRFEANYFHGISYYFEFCSVIDRRLEMKIESLSQDISHEH